MKALITFLLACLFSGAMAQGNLPACQGQVVSKWNKCFGSKSYASGNKYVGEYRGGKRNGQFIVTYANGDKYVGEFKDNRKNGQGTNTFANGTKYVGEYKDGKRNGQGTYTFANGNKYVGEFKDDKRNGQFIVTYANGDKYVGEFRGNTKNGQGTYTLANGSKYVGEYRDGKRNGQFTVTYANGSKYVGEFKDDKRNGQGITFLANGKVDKSGIWKDGVLALSKFIDVATFTRATPPPIIETEKFPACQGQVVSKWNKCIGSKSYANGSKYVGEYRDGKRNGQFIVTYANGDKYVGEFRGNTKNGQGTYTLANGSKYVGEYRDGKRNGQFIVTYANGDKYVGEFKDDKLNGQGTYTFANGSIYVGEYKNNRRDGQGTRTYSNGAKYIGEWGRGLKDGRGILLSPNGTIKESGIFEKGKLIRSQDIDVAAFSQSPKASTASVAKRLAAENERLKAAVEKERLRKEAEEVRRKNDELRAQLAQLSKENELLTKSRPTPNASPAPPPSATTVMARRRALVIGNDDYKTISKLENAVEDATAMAESLKKLGYQVDAHTNLGQRQFMRALRNFRADLKGGEEVLFFFAGHGVQLGNSNYLLPTDLGSDSAAQVRDESIDLQRVLNDFAEQKTKFALAVIDACRDNPFKQSKRAIGGRGLAPTTAATGQMIMFSAGAGQQALDKLDKNDNSPNGLFTRVFLEEMRKPGVPVDQVLRSVRERVVSMAGSVGHEQVPALYDQAIGRFYFKPK